MRLRQDGHGTLHLAGPAGLAAGSRACSRSYHGCTPAVQVLESSPYDVPIVYKVRASLHDASRSACHGNVELQMSECQSMCLGFVDPGQSC